MFVDPCRPFSILHILLVHCFRPHFKTIDKSSAALFPISLFKIKLVGQNVVAITYELNLHREYSKYYVTMTHCMNVYIINGHEVKEIQLSLPEQVTL